MNQKKMSVVGKLWWLIYPILLFFGAQVAGFLIVRLIAAILGGIEVPADTVNYNDVLEQVKQSYRDAMSPYMGILTGLIPIPFAVLLMKRDIKCRALDGGEPKKTGVLSWVAIFFGFAGYCLFFNFFVTITRLREMFPSFDESAAADYENPPIFVYLGSAILAPIVEELIFRGLTFKRARSLTSFFPAALISGVIFGIAHMNILQGIYTCIMGLTLCYIFEKKQTILAPIIGHFGVNSIGILTTYVLPESFYTFEGVLTITLVSGAICIICFGFLFAKFHKLPAWQIKNLVE